MLTFSDTFDGVTAGSKVTIMGLGLHGGGLACAHFLAEKGASLCITDLRDAQTLAPSIKKLEEFEALSAKSYNIRYTLGEHLESDFTGADFVVKNPGVNANNPYLKISKAVESDLSLFCKELRSRKVSPYFMAVSGSKGKSTVVSACYAVLRQLSQRKVFLGGNITESPLNFIDEIDNESIVILELSSWQLHDLAPHRVFSPNVAALTNIFPEHLNSYASFDDYVADKALLIEMANWAACPLFLPQPQSKGDKPSVLASQVQHHDRQFFIAPYCEASEREQDPCWYSDSDKPFVGQWKPPVLGQNNKAQISLELVPREVHLLGDMNRTNLFYAACLAYVALENEPEKQAQIAEAIASFKGISHRLELLETNPSVHCYNDSASTMPQATWASVQAMKCLERTVLITGGTDKQGDYSCYGKDEFAQLKGIVVLAGSAQHKICEQLDGQHVMHATVKDLEEACKLAQYLLHDDDSLLFSPGCSSFEQYNNEFERGNHFKKLVSALFN